MTCEQCRGTEWASQCDSCGAVVCVTCWANKHVGLRPEDSYKCVDDGKPTIGGYLYKGRWYKTKRRDVIAKNLDFLDKQEIEVSRPPKGWPTRVMFASQRWDVLYSPNLMTVRDLYGYTHPPRHAMVVDSSQAQDGMAETLLHEVLHMVLSDHSAGLDHETEEKVVNLMASRLLDVMRSNPALIDALVGE